MNIVGGPTSTSPTAGKTQPYIDNEADRGSGGSGKRTDIEEIEEVTRWNKKKKKKLSTAHANFADGWEGATV